MMLKKSVYSALALFGLLAGCMGEVGDPLRDPPKADAGGQTADDSGVVSPTDGGVAIADAGGVTPTDCDEGFALVGDSCQDIDECAMTSSPCSDNATCTNEPGSFTCDCDTGFVGDGLTCVPAAADCSDFAAVLADNRCVTCHDQTPGVEGGDLDLLSPGLADRLLDRPSGNSSCGGEPLINRDSPSDSLFLRLVDPERYAAWSDPCIGRMPFGGDEVSAADVTCFEQWVEETVAAAPPPPPPPPTVTETMPAASALTKAKFILHGGPVTDAELDSALAADDTLHRPGLRTVIQGWIGTPAFNQKIQSFLKLALQQQEVDPRTLILGQAYRDQFDPMNNVNTPFVIDRNRFIDSLDEIFVRTAWDIVRQRRDFRQVVTTRRWKVTTAILAALVYAERPQMQRDNHFKLLAHLRPSDYNDWRDVNLTQAQRAADVPTYANTAAFVTSLRNISNGGSLALRAPRVGFFNTPTFFENWQTNSDNLFRVSTNQALITALDLSFEAGDTTPQNNENGLARDHANPNTACYQCHQKLDPMRLVYQNIYTTRYRMLNNPVRNLEPSFAFQGHTAPLTSMDEFAQALVGHPRFAAAWVQKLCMWANSQRCLESDPEFQRLVTRFERNFDLLGLIIDFFISPLSTGFEATATHESTDFMISIARSNHMCHALQLRIESARAERCDAERAANPNTNPAVCQARGQVGCDANQLTRSMAELISSDTFGRGDPAFVQQSVSGPLNARAMTEMCTQLANREVGFNNHTFTPTDVAGSLDRMVRLIMGLPSSHPRYEEAREGLRRAFDIGQATPDCATSGGDIVADNSNEITCGLALNRQRALFVPWIIACSSPELAGQGM
ncbi:MAG: calcium-binding EGF-like domain-containing protein [Myxococcota bacterium]